MAKRDPAAISDDADRRDIAEIAAYLQLHLGEKLTAYLAGVAEPKTVDLSRITACG